MRSPADQLAGGVSIGHYAAKPPPPITQEPKTQLECSDCFHEQNEPGELCELHTMPREGRVGWHAGIVRIIFLSQLLGYA